MSMAELRVALDIGSLRADYTPESKIYYDRKRAEGKSHNQAVRALGRHMVRGIWSMTSTSVITFRGRDSLHKLLANSTGMFKASIFAPRKTQRRKQNNALRATPTDPMRHILPLMDETYGFKVKMDAERFTYTCQLCGALVDGGPTESPGLFDRMRAHLREGDCVDNTRDLAPTAPTDDSNGSIGVRFVRPPVHRGYAS